jgi:hypothetical protein
LSDRRGRIRTCPIVATFHTTFVGRRGDGHLRSFTTTTTITIITTSAITIITAATDTSIIMIPCQLQSFGQGQC